MQMSKAKKKDSEINPEILYEREKEKSGQQLNCTADLSGQKNSSFEVTVCILGPGEVFFAGAKFEVSFNDAQVYFDIG